MRPKEKEVMRLEVLFDGPESIYVNGATQQHGHEESVETAAHRAITLEWTQPQTIQVLSKLRENTQLPIYQIRRVQIEPVIWIATLHPIPIEKRQQGNGCILFHQGSQVATIVPDAMET